MKNKWGCRNFFATALTVIKSSVNLPLSSSGFLIENSFTPPSQQAVTPPLSGEAF